MARRNDPLRLQAVCVQRGRLVRPFSCLLADGDGDCADGIRGRRTACSRSRSGNRGFDSRINEPVISVRLKPAAAQAFARFTQQHIGRKVDLRVDGKTVSRPVVREPIIGGTLIIAGITTSEARQVADSLSSAKARLDIDVAAE